MLKSIHYHTLLYITSRVVNVKVELENFFAIIFVVLIKTFGIISIR